MEDRKEVIPNGWYKVFCDKIFTREISKLCYQALRIEYETLEQIRHTNRIQFDELKVYRYKENPRCSLWGSKPETTKYYDEQGTTRAIFSKVDSLQPDLQAIVKSKQRELDAVYENLVAIINDRCANILTEQPQRAWQMQQVKKHYAFDVLCFRNLYRNIDHLERESLENNILITLAALTQMEDFRYMHNIYNCVRSIRIGKLQIYDW